MAALAGRLARIKLCAQTATKSTDEAATLAPGGLVLSIDDASKRHWDRSLTSTPQVLIAGATATPLGSTNYSVDYAAGTITFATARSTAAAITLDVNYLAASYLGKSRGWTVDADVDMMDTTTLSTGAAPTRWRTFKAGLSGASVTLDRFLDDSTGRQFYDLLNVGSDLVLELISSTGAGGFQGYGYVERDSMSDDIGGLASEQVSVRVDGPLTYTTNL